MRRIWLRLRRRRWRIVLSRSYHGAIAEIAVDISERYIVPDTQELFSISPNKAGLFNFLCERWCDEEQLEPTLSSTRLCLGGGFKDEMKSVRTRYI